MNTGDRLLSILRLFTIQRPKWTVEAAAQEIDVSISTAYRYFRALCKIGLLDPFDASSYVLGPAIIEYDRQMRLNDPLIRTGQPVMRRLIERSGGTGISLLCRIYHNRVMCIHEECSTTFRNVTSYDRGRPMPMFHGASSKIIFANLPSRSVRWFFAKFAREISEAGLGSDWESIKTNLRKIRKARVLVTVGEVDRDRMGIAAPVFGPNKNLLGSVSLVFAQNEATRETVANSSALVFAAGEEIHAGLCTLQSNYSLPAQPHRAVESALPEVTESSWG